MFACECRESLHRRARQRAARKYRLEQFSHGVRYDCVTSYSVMLFYSLSLLSPSSPDFSTSSGLCCSSVNLLVSRANLTVAATISREGLHFKRSPSFVSPDQPPSAKDRSPHLLDLVAGLHMLRRWSVHKGHLNKKWSTDSVSRLQLQVSTSIEPILARYLLSLHMPDLSWHSAAASICVFPLYNAKVCFPGRALSKLWVNFPICENVTLRRERERARKRFI